MTEIMITVGLLAIISVPLYFFLSDSSKRANIIQARDYIKQESNKVLNVLENDLSQAKYGSFTQTKDGFSIKVHQKKDNHEIYGNEKEDYPVLKYTFDQPKLHRYDYGINKCWLVSDQVDSLDIEEATHQGQLIIKLKMKSRIVGIKDSEQPTYEQDKVVSMREYSAKGNQKNWFGVGKLTEYEGDNNLIDSLRTDVAQFYIAQSEKQEDDNGKYESMSLAEMEKALEDLKNSKEELRKSAIDFDNQILGMDWKSYYDNSWASIIKGGLGKTTNINKTLFNLKSKNAMNSYTYGRLRNEADIGSNLFHEDTLRSMWDSKIQIFEGEENLNKEIAKCETEIAKRRAETK